MEFKQTQLDNGLTVIVELNPAAASMAAGFFVRTGSRDETPEVAGVSHFLEHMIFKGTERRSAFDVNREFDQMGAMYNAFTSEENTVYFGAVLPEFQDRLLDLLCDILRPALRGEDFDIEKNVIVEEIALYQDRPSYRTYEMLMGRYFAGHPLGNRVLGTTESIRALKQSDMQAYFDARYCPANVTVVAVGNVDFNALVDKVGQGCAHWEPREVSRQILPAPQEPTQAVICDAKVAREHIGLMSAAPAAQDELRYAAELAATVLGDVTGSRLFYALVEPAIADEAHTSYSPMDQTGAFITFISTDPQRSGQAVKIARDEFKKLCDGGLTDTELQAAKNKIASGATLKGELPMGRLTSVGFDWVYRREYLPLADQIEILFAITLDQVQQLVQDYDLTAATVLALGPVEKL